MLTIVFITQQQRYLIHSQTWEYLWTYDGNFSDVKQPNGRCHCNVAAAHAPSWQYVAPPEVRQAAHASGILWFCHRERQPTDTNTGGCFMVTLICLSCWSLYGYLDVSIILILGYICWCFARKTNGFSHFELFIGGHDDLYVCSRKWYCF